MNFSARCRERTNVLHYYYYYYLFGGKHLKQKSSNTEDRTDSPHFFLTIIAAIFAQTHHITRRTILCCRRNARKRTQLGDIKPSEKKKRNKKQNWNKTKIEYFAMKNRHSSRKIVFACVGRTRRHFPLFISIKSRTIFSYFNGIVKPAMSWVVCTR